nr:hypothetical protein [Tanacetum cinerariifolium]
PVTLELPDRIAGELRAQAEAIGIACGCTRLSPGKAARQMRSGAHCAGRRAGSAWSCGSFHRPAVAGPKTRLYSVIDRKPRSCRPG